MSEENLTADQAPKFEISGLDVWIPENSGFVVTNRVPEYMVTIFANNHIHFQGWEGDIDPCFIVGHGPFVSSPIVFDYSPVVVPEFPT